MIRKVIATAALAAAVTLAVAAPASAGIYTWKHAGTYASNADCLAAGPAVAAAEDADTWRCTGADLYVGFIW